MADGIIIRTNLPAFKAQLAALGARLERRIVARGLNAAGRVLRESARRFAPVLKGQRKGRVAGALRRAIYVGRSKQSKPGRPIVVVGVRASKAQQKRGVDPFYWRFLEGGWLPRGPGRKLRGGVRSRALQRERAIKAGSRRVAYPFLAPAFRLSSGAALDAFERAVAQGIEAENRTKA